MRKLLKIVDIVKIIVISVIVLILTGMLCVELPAVQTVLTGKLLDRFDDNSAFDISCGHIHVRPFNVVVLKDVLVIDKHPYVASPEKLALLDVKEPVDTFAAAGLITARFSIVRMLHGGPLEFRRIVVRDGVFNLVIEPSCIPEVPVSNNLVRIFGIDQTRPKSPDDGKVKFVADKVTVKNFHYTMRNISDRRPPANDKGIDWGDLDTYGINADARNLMLKGKVMSGVCDHLETYEKSGYFLSHISAGDVSVGNGRAYVGDIHIDDGYSDARFDHYAMYFHDARSFRHFVDSVRIDGVINKGSILDSYTLGFFAPVLIGKDMTMDASGCVTGPLRDLDISGLRFDGVALRPKEGYPSLEDPSAFSASFSGHLTGLRDARTPERPLSFTARIDSCRTTASAFWDIAYRFTGKPTEDSPYRKLPFEWADTMPMNPEIFVEGSTDGSITASVSSVCGEDGVCGSFAVDARATGLFSDTDKIISADASVVTEDLDLKAFLGGDLLGPATISLSADALVPKKDVLKGLKANIRSLDISRLNFKGYDLQNISAGGSISEGRVAVRLNGDDPALTARLSVTGNINYRSADASIVMDNINLSELGLIKAADVSSSFVLDAALAPEYSELALTDVVFARAGEESEVPAVSVTADRDSVGWKANITSEMFKASYRGEDAPDKFAEAFVGLTLKKNIPALFKNPAFVADGKRYSLTASIGDMSKLLTFIKPGLYIEPGTSLNLVVSPEGLVNADMRSSHLALSENELTDFNFNLNNRQGAIRAMAFAKELHIKDNVVSNPAAQVYGSNGNIGLGISYEREYMSGGKGELYIRGTVGRTPANDNVRLSLELLPSTIHFASSSWKISSSYAEIVGKAFRINGFNASYADKSISLSGARGFSDRDELLLSVSNLDLSVVDDIIKGLDFGLEGRINGNAILSGRGLTGRFTGSGTSLGGVSLGTMHISDDWNEADQKFHFALMTDRMIRARGSYAPKTGAINAGMTLDSLDVSLVHIVTKNVLDDVSGFLSGHVEMSGNFPDFKLSSDALVLSAGKMKVKPTGTTYMLDGPISLTDQGVNLDLNIRDSGVGSGKLSGGLSFNRFRDIRLDAQLEHSRLESLNLDAPDLLPVSGLLHTSGKIRVCGPLDNLSVDAGISTVGDGKLNFDLSNIAQDNTTDILTFVQKTENKYIDPYDAMMADLKKKKESSVKIYAGVNVDSQTALAANIDGADSRITINGQGLVEMEVDPKRDIFNLNGNYNIESGDVNVMVLGLVGRNFTIKKGSSVRFGGNIAESTLDVEAVYKTRTSLANLISDSTAVNVRRNVECVLHMSDRLANPTLNFSINIPEIDPSAKSMVESALSTEDKIQKQFVALLVSNNFLPDEQSGIENATSDALFSNVSGIMSNQLSNIFQRFDIPLDLGLKYQPTNYGNDMFDVAISTQLFNNRVLINGNLGNRRLETSQGPIAGDLEVEFKVNPSGTLRLNVFTRSSDGYTNYLDNLQRTGAGISYRREYDNFGKMIKYIFSSRAKKEMLDEKMRSEATSEQRKLIVQ